MQKYIYKGFEIYFNVKSNKNNASLFMAHGYAECQIDQGQSKGKPIQFRTEDNSPVAAKKQFKKLVESYVDFEWHAFEKVPVEQRV